MGDYTAKERMARFRAERKAAGLKRLELWAKPQHHEPIRRYAETLKAEKEIKATIPLQDREHIKQLLRWSDQAAARGDMESSNRLLMAAHEVMIRHVLNENAKR